MYDRNALLMARSSAAPQPLTCGVPRKLYGRTHTRRQGAVGSSCRTIAASKKSRISQTAASHEFLMTTPRQSRSNHADRLHSALGIALPIDLEEHGLCDRADEPPLGHAPEHRLQELHVDRLLRLPQVRVAEVDPVLQIEVHPCSPHSVAHDGVLQRREVLGKADPGLGAVRFQQRGHVRTKLGIESRHVLLPVLPPSQRRL